MFKDLVRRFVTKLSMKKSPSVRIAPHASRSGAERLRAIPETRSGSDEILEAAHRHCFRNRKEVLASDQCGCFYCGRIFNPHEISEWHDDGETAFCPHCGIDAIIGSAARLPLTADLLERMNRYWF